jgi:hypothetical protein
MRILSTEDKKFSTELSNLLAFNTINDPNLVITVEKLFLTFAITVIATY